MHCFLAPSLAGLRTTRLVAVLVLSLALHLSAGVVTYGQDERLPFAPDSIYAMVTGTAEAMIEGHEIPPRLSAEAWQADLDTLAARIQQHMPYPAAATGGRFRSTCTDLPMAHTSCAPLITP